MRYKKYYKDVLEYCDIFVKYFEEWRKYYHYV